MKILTISALPILILLTACGTPQEQCIGTASRDLRVLDGLIQQSQASIARGYGYQDVVITTPQYVDCTPKPTEENPKPRRQMCLTQVAQTVQKPVAIDLTAEQAKLNGMLTKRAQLVKSTEASVQACKAAYPQ